MGANSAKAYGDQRDWGETTEPRQRSMQFWKANRHFKGPLGLSIRLVIWLKRFPPLGHGLLLVVAAR